MKIAYNPDSRVYNDYFASGGRLPVFRGGGGGIPVFRGSGIGNVIGGILRSAVPLLKSAGKTILKTGAKTGMHIANDMLSGESFKSAAKKRAKNTAKGLLSEFLPAPPGEPNIKLTRKRKRPQSSKGRRRVKKDIFD